MVAPLTYEQLTAALLVDQTTAIADATDASVSLLTGSGVGVITDYAPGTFERDFVSLAAFNNVQAALYAASLATQLIEPTASGSALDKVSNGSFANQRFLGTFSRGNLVLRLSPGPSAGPYTVSPGGVTVTFNGVFTFTNDNTFSLTSGSSVVTSSFTATQSGQAYNVPYEQTGSIALAGVTVTNPFVPSLGGWLTQEGQDMESDAALHIRNQTKWSTLATGGVPEDRITHVVVSASLGQLTDVFSIPGLRGPGTIDVYCATPTQVASPSQLAMVSGTVQGLYFNGSSLINVQAPSTLVFGSGGQNTAIRVWYDPAYDPTVVSTNVQLAFNAWLGGGTVNGLSFLGIPTGGSTYDAADANLADVGELVTAINSVPGVRRTKLTNQADITLATSPVQKLVGPASWAAPFLQLMGSSR